MEPKDDKNSKNYKNDDHKDKGNERKHSITFIF